MSRLTKLEMHMLARAAEFVLAGEWPWDEGDSPKQVRQSERELHALISASTKLGGR